MKDQNMTENIPIQTRCTSLKLVCREQADATLIEGLRIDFQF